MKGFDLYEQWRSCVFQVSGMVAPSWDALEVWEKIAWEKFDNYVDACIDSNVDEERRRHTLR